MIGKSSISVYGDQEIIMGKDKKKTSYILRLGMTVLTVILIVLFLGIMGLVSKIQGTARVVNYSGLVRGSTQRLTKLEDAGEPRDDLMEKIQSFIDGLQNGSEELNLVSLQDKAFQTKMVELNAYFQELKEELLKVREVGYENTDIIAMSEQFFGICDEATSLAEDYSQRKASELNVLEQIVVADIIGLLILIGIELLKALRYAAQNRILQGKVYLDEATGLPNKNKCEEILNDPQVFTAEDAVALMVFDLNNLRTINNRLGHEKGDEYIRSFAQQMRLAVPEQHFAGRDGGDEFIAVLKSVNREEIEQCLQSIKEQCAKYSEEYPQMPISYAAGYAWSGDFDGTTMRELFRLADKNMYIDKNRAKLEEAEREKQLNYQLLAEIREKGLHFSDCLYCDALQDQYRVLRASSSFYLAEDGSYSGAVEQVVQEVSTNETRRSLWAALQIEKIAKELTQENEKIEIPYQYLKENVPQRGRLTFLFSDATMDGQLHHFILGFETFHDKAETEANEKLQLTQYYEQMKNSILENGDYVDALMDTAQAVCTVNLTEDWLEKIYYHTDMKEFDIGESFPCSYDEYCRSRTRFITAETLENYRIVDTSAKLLRRFKDGDKQITVEYREEGRDGRQIWLQKTVLMSQDTVYDSRTNRESTVVHGIILFKDTSAFHEKEEQEKERLQIAYEEADSASRAKSEFMNRMSHDIRTPINGIMGMVEIIRRNKDDDEKLEDCLRKIQTSSDHLLALVNDVLDMGKLESGHLEFKQESFDLEQLMKDVASLVNAQLTETGLVHRRHRENMQHIHLIGCPLRVRQIMLNLFSNSIKYNKPGGSIDTYAKEVSCDGDQVLYEFKIEDTGVGMSEDFVKNQLFHPFTQESSDARTQYRGTGLGMSIVKELIEKMGGSIQVQSVLGEGTTYTFQLPFQVDPAQTAEHAGSADDAGMSADHAVSDGQELAGRHILLVEDNEINMEIAVFYLEDHGAQVEKAWNGQEAVEQFAAAAPGAFDLILMDVMMPVMDGLEATRRIRKMEKEDAQTIPILAMTAQASRDSEQQCLDAGMNGQLSKPVDAKRLIERILKSL